MARRTDNRTAGGGAFGEVVLNDQSIAGMDAAAKIGMSPSDAAQVGLRFSNGSWNGSAPQQDQPFPSAPSLPQPMAQPQAQTARQRPLGFASTPAGATDPATGINGATGSQYSEPTNMTRTASGSEFVGKDYTMGNVGTSSALSNFSIDPRKGFKGLASGGSVSKSKPGIIPGKRNDKVADDTLIKAKKGEYVIPTEAVDVYGAAFFDRLIKQAKKMKGVPQTVGPKTGNFDSKGRKDAGKALDTGPAGYQGGGMITLPDGTQRAKLPKDDRGGSRDASGQLTTSAEAARLAASDAVRGNVPVVVANESGLPATEMRPYGSEGTIKAHTNTNDPAKVFPQSTSTKRSQPALPTAAQPDAPTQATAGQTDKQPALPAPAMPTAQRPTLTSPLQQDAAAIAQKLLANYKGGPQAAQMGGNELFNMSFVGKANINNPSYRNAMMERMKWDKNNAIQMDEVKNHQSAVQHANTAGGQVYASDNALIGHNNAALGNMYGADQNAAAHKYTADARSKDEGEKRKHESAIMTETSRRNDMAAAQGMLKEYVAMYNSPTTIDPAQKALLAEKIGALEGEIRSRLPGQKGGQKAKPNKADGMDTQQKTAKRDEYLKKHNGDAAAARKAAEADGYNL